MKRPGIGALIALLAGVCTAGASRGDEGLVVDYTFEQGSGDAVIDRSGNGNHATIHGAEWVSSQGVRALRFDGVDDFLECASAPSLDLTDAVTLEAWIRPERPTTPPCEAGIVGKGIAHFGAYGLTYLRDRAYVYVTTTTNNCAVALPMKTWSHVAGTFDGRMLAIYLDGRLIQNRKSMADRIGVTGEALFLGRNRYKGMNFFPGAMGGVRIYGRALAEEEIRGHYLGETKRFGIDVTLFRRIVVKPHLYRAQDKIVAEVDVRDFLPLPDKAYAGVYVYPPKEGLNLASVISPLSGAGVFEVPLDAGELPPGDYELRASLIPPEPVAEAPSGSAAFTWPDPPAWRNADPPVKPLNNLVMELLNVRDEDGIAERSFAFTNPYEGWVFFQRAADPDEEGTVVLVLGSGDSMTTREAMRFLPEGRHEITVNAKDAKVKNLVVRSVPQIMWCKLYPAPYLPHVKAYGPYDWAFFERARVLDNINVMISRRDVPLDTPEHAQYLADWARQGKQWIVEVGLTKSLSGEEVAESWLNEEGVRHAQTSGILIDEFGGNPAEDYCAWAAGMRLAAKDPRLAGKTLYPYCGALPEYRQAADFVKSVMESGQRFAWEVYAGEEPTIDDMGAALDAELRQRMIAWRDAAPGVERQMVLALAFFSAPPETCDRCPNVNYKVFMDKQLNLVANAPEFAGLFGVLEYTSAYADEEIVRWTTKLYRHYLIDGNTSMLSADPLILTHVANGDFEEEGRGWTLSPAEEGSIAFGVRHGYGWTQGRYPAGPAGNTFLCTRRSAKAPNAFSQTIRDLTPGRAYSLKMYVADGKDLKAAEHHAVRIEIRGVDMLPEKSVDHVYAGCHSGSANPPHFNFRGRVFRAQAETAMLAISDWASEKKPGGSAGQELIFNFIQVEPYLEE